jgi:hypothetical protein
VQLNSFSFYQKEKAEFLELENLLSIQEVFYRKKKLLYDILYEIPIRNSSEKENYKIETARNMKNLG